MTYSSENLFSVHFLKTDEQMNESSHRQQKRVKIKFEINSDMKYITT